MLNQKKSKGRLTHTLQSSCLLTDFEGFLGDLVTDDGNRRTCASQDVLLENAQFPSTEPFTFISLINLRHVPVKRCVKKKKVVQIPPLRAFSANSGTFCWTLSFSLSCWWGMCVFDSLISQNKKQTEFHKSLWWSSAGQIDCAGCVLFDVVRRTKSCTDKDDKGMLSYIWSKCIFFIILCVFYMFHEH